MKYFSLQELTDSPRAKAQRIPNNIPSPEIEANLIALIEHILDPVRELLGSPIRVSSGYRSPRLNTVIGGAKGSQHTKGEAADLRCNDNARLFKLIKAQGRFDQLIWEHGNDSQPAWIHVSYRRDGHNRHQTLKAISHHGQTKYIPY